MTTLGKYRHLTRCATDAGHLVILAIDHRAPLRKALDAQAAAPLTDAEFSAFKTQVIAASAAQASAILTDPAFGLAPAIRSRALGRAGLLAPLEVTNYEVHPSAAGIHFMPDWSAAKAKRAGCDGVKLLLYYHPDAPDAAAKQAAVGQIVADCAEADLPLFLEPIAHSLDPQTRLNSAETLAVTLRMCAQFVALGVDVLKLHFPLDPAQTPDPAAWREACQQVNAACGVVPWALLSGGVPFEQFVQQASAACSAGASGVIVGRAVWNEAITLQGEARDAFIKQRIPERLRQLAQVCAAQAEPWHTRVPAPASAPDAYR